MKINEKWTKGALPYANYVLEPLKNIIVEFPQVGLNKNIFGWFEASPIDLMGTQGSPPNATPPRNKALLRDY